MVVGVAAAAEAATERSLNDVLLLGDIVTCLFVTRLILHDMK